MLHIQPIPFILIHGKAIRVFTRIGVFPAILAHRLKVCQDAGGAAFYCDTLLCDCDALICDALICDAFIRDARSMVCGLSQVWYSSRFSVEVCRGYI